MYRRLFSVFSMMVFLLFFSILTTTTGCSFTGPYYIPVDDVQKLTIPETFDYRTVRSVTVDLDFSGGTVDFSRIPVLIHAADRPLTEDMLAAPGESQEPFATSDFPLLAQVFLDEDSKYQGILSVPSIYTQLIVSPQFSGLPDNIVVPIVMGKAGFSLADGQDSRLASRDLSVRDLRDTSRVYREPDNEQFSYISALTEGVKPFDVNGRSLNILPAESSPEVTRELLDNVNSSLPEYRANTDRLSDAVLRMTEEAEVTVTFLHEGAGYRNAFGFVVYNDDDLDSPGELPSTPPTITEDRDGDGHADLKLVFPNASLLYSGGTMEIGDSVVMGNFAAGDNLILALIANGWSSSAGRNTPGLEVYYSYRDWNPEPEAYNQHTVILVEEEDQDGSAVLVVGFEDLNRSGGKGDNDFNDLVLLLTVTPARALEGLSDPDLFKRTIKSVDTDLDGIHDVYDLYPDNALLASEIRSEGTVAFEDKWPALGDYDFNDLVVAYRYLLRTDAENYVRSLTWEYEILALGAGQKNGLSLKLPVSMDELLDQNDADFDVLRIAGPGEEFGEADAEALERLSDRLETDGNSLVVRIFQNANRDVLGTETTRINTEIGGATISSVAPGITPTVSGTLYFAGGRVTPESLGSLPFDLFLLSSGNEGYEIHLPNYAPTGLGTVSSDLLRTADDDSRPAENRWYLSRNNLPWALHLPTVWDYPVEQVQILKAYPQFGEWAFTGGESRPGWYLAEGSDRVPEFIYNLVP